MKKIRQQTITNSSFNRAHILVPLLLLSLALVFTAAIGDSAAATESDNLTINSSTSSPLLSDSDNTSVVGPDPNVIRGGVVVYTTGSIQDAIDNAQTGDIIRLENGATFNEHGLTIPGTITSLTFDVWNAAHTGPGGTATINGEDNQILTINQDMTVNIFNIIFRDGSTSDGGAIFNDRGILTCTGCDFIGNIATSIGGAIFNYMGVLTCSDCDFLDNIATNAAGAIYNDMGDMTFTDCDFISNSADDGGAICNDDGTCECTYCVFLTNTANNGAAIYFDDGTCECTYCDFTDNAVDDDGGAIYNDDGEFQCNYCAFDGNYADDEGGAIFNYYGVMDCSMCEFFDNMAYEGGAICNEDGDLTCNKCDFTQNSADYGGALYNEEYGPGSTLEVNNSSFTHNDAINDGGAIYNMAPSTFNNCDFTGNSVWGSGGAIYNDDEELICNYCDFTQNSADYDGGAIYNNGDFTTVIGCNLVNNYVGYDGGAFYNDGEEFILNFNRIIGNTAGDEGPDIFDGSTDTDDLHNALYNWWGSNLGPAAGRIIGELVEYDPWLVMRYGANPAVITQGGTSTLTANFRYDSDGTYHNPALGHLPDGLPVTFTTNMGNVGSKSVITYTHYGLATAVLRGDEGTGVALTSASMDSETRHASITINAASASGAVRTIGMQETGTPLFGLVLAILLVLGEFITHRKQQ